MALSAKRAEKLERTTLHQLVQDPCPWGLPTFQLTSPEFMRAESNLWYGSIAFFTARAVDDKEFLQLAQPPTRHRRNLSLMDTITYQPIGVAHTPFTTLDGMPLQTVAAYGIRGSVELDPALSDGLRDLNAFSHLILLTHLHQMSGYALEVTPYLDDQSHGIFATRSPRRPNPIGLSIVRLIAIQDATLLIEDVDLLDGTPVLDLKPYVPTFDARETERIGWFAGRIERVQTTRSDKRFTES